MIGIINRLKEIIQRTSRTPGFTAVQGAIFVATAVVTAGAISTVIVASSSEASQDVDQTVHQTINSIQGTFMIKGDVYAKAAAAGPSAVISQIVFNVGLVCSDGSMDFIPPVSSASNNGLAGDSSTNSIIISYTDTNQHIANLFWTVTPLGKNNGDQTLDGGELFQITIGGSTLPGINGGNLIDALNPGLTKDTRFTIEMSTAQGAVCTFEGQIPPTVKKVNCLR